MSMDFRKFTNGDNYNIECPHCGRINHYVCNGRKVELEKIIQFEEHCYNCGKLVYYEAKYEISVIARCRAPMNKIA